VIEAVPAYRLARGVRLRLSTDGATLLVPEGIVALSDSAAAILELVDGQRDEAAIATVLAERFEAPAAELSRDVAELLAALAERGFVQC
jgi:pyrroloquinoline quinone biosynthesis protein D